MNDCGLRGVALLDAAIAQVEAHPETWHQEAWRCGSGMCMAGWVSELGGGRWVEDDEDGDYADILHPEPYDPPDTIGHFARLGRDGVMAGDRARTLLGTTDVSSLFAPFNDLAQIKVIRDRLVRHGVLS